jgi:hypothetical protein
LEIEDPTRPELLEALHSGPLSEVGDIGEAHEASGLLFLHLGEGSGLSDSGGRGSASGLVIDLRAIAVGRVGRDEGRLLLVVRLSLAVSMSERERERERQRQRDKQTDRQTKRMGEWKEGG